ncbi:MAG: cytochrome c [Bacteroidota bacterium]|nr:cytochrome c [Bacteroidota bacterium]
MRSIKMKRDLLIVFYISMILFNCSRENGLSQTSSASSDSVKSLDALDVGLATTISIHFTYEQRQGKYIYTKYCSVCHGMEGKGDGFNAFSLDPKPRDLSNEQYMKSFTDDRLVETVREGGRGVNRSPLMPSWGGRLTKDELLYVIAYVKKFAVSTDTHK